MTMFAQNEPLTEIELSRLNEFLKNCSNGKAMNTEEVDGFFSALIAGPEIVMPSEYLPELLGDNAAGTHPFATLSEANEILALLMRHWNNIAGTLSKGVLYLPHLLEDENGVEHGNDWARGFIRGTHLRHDRWTGLLADDNHGGCMIPVLMLYHEHDEDAALRPKPVGSEQRKKLIASIPTGLALAYRYFRQQEKSSAVTRGFKRGYKSAKISRNDACPCGSGKKYKRCCGGETVH